MQTERAGTILKLEVFINHIIRSSSGGVPLTFDECLLKWDSFERKGGAQHKRKEQTTAGQAPPPRPPPPQPSAGGVRRKRGITWCNQFNMPAGINIFRNFYEIYLSLELYFISNWNISGCAGTPTPTGCSWPNGMQFRHGCKFRKADGSFCNKMDHNQLNHN